MEAVGGDTRRLNGVILIEKLLDRYRLSLLLWLGYALKYDFASGVS